jgi:membrane associated rhomboid family serine protease
MLPFRDDNPTERPAILCGVLIAINAFVFFFVQPSLDDPTEQTIYFMCNAAIPDEVMHGELLADSVAVAPPISSERELTAAVEQERCPHKNVWFSIFRSMFFHGGFAHIGFNMLFLWVFGNNIEDRLGRVKFLILYFLSGIAATYAHSVVFPGSSTPVIGASGAIAGVLGAYLVLFPHARVTSLFFYIVTDLPAVVVLGFWFLVQVLQQVGSVAGEAGGVAYMAHIGGFVAGMLLLLVLRPVRRRLVGGR